MVDGIEVEALRRLHVSFAKDRLETRRGADHELAGRPDADLRGRGGAQAQEAVSSTVPPVAWAWAKIVCIVEWFEPKSNVCENGPA